MKIDTDFCESGVRINFRFTQEDLNNGGLESMKWAMLYLAEKVSDDYESMKFTEWFHKLKKFQGGRGANYAD